MPMGTGVATTYPIPEYAMADPLSSLLDPLSLPFMQRGLLSAAMLGVSGGLLGCLLVLRRLALVGDALAHSLLPGMALAFLLFGTSPAGLFAGALAAGAFTSIGSAFVSRLTRVKEDAAFAALFVVFFGGGIALVSMIGPRVNLLHFLFGNILSVGPTDLWLSAGVSSLTVAIFLLFYRSIALETFDPVFYRASGARGSFVHFGLLGLVALNLVAALQAMGIVLALGLFILPAVTAYLWTERLPAMLGLSALIAVTGAFLGIVASYHWSIASGACIALALGAIFIASAIGSPRHGLVTRWLRQRGAGRRVLRSQE
jgi:zinc/manganese transport system permease protein